MDIAKSHVVIAAILAVSTLSPVSLCAEAPGRAMPPTAARLPTMQPPVMRGLSNPALKLSADQKARIDKIMEGYIHEEHALNQRYSAPGAQRGAEAALASKQAWERMTAAMDQVLDVPQRQILKAEQAEQAEKAAQAAKAAMAARGVAPTREQPRSR